MKHGKCHPVCPMERRLCLRDKSDGPKHSQYTIGPNGALTPMTRLGRSRQRAHVNRHRALGQVRLRGEQPRTAPYPYTIGMNGRSPNDPGLGRDSDRGMADLRRHRPLGHIRLRGERGSWQLWQPRLVRDRHQWGALLPVRAYSLGTYYLSSIAVHPSGKYAYVTTLRNDYLVYQYTIGADGALTPMTPASVPAGSGPRQITLHPRAGTPTWRATISEPSLSTRSTPIPGRSRRWLQSRRGCNPSPSRSILGQVRLRAKLERQ